MNDKQHRTVSGQAGGHPGPDEEQLPSYILNAIEEGRRDGVTYSVERKHSHVVTAIHWKPGDPNKLAESIVKHTHWPLPLDLDGHYYLVIPTSRLFAVGSHTARAVRRSWGYISGLSQSRNRHSPRHRKEHPSA